MPIDRDPEIFDYVLDFLRNGCKLSPGSLPTDERTRMRLRKEFDYFLLPDPFGGVEPTWIEKFGASTVAAKRRLRMPSGANVFHVRSVEHVVFSEDSTHLVALFLGCPRKGGREACPPCKGKSCVVMAWELGGGQGPGYVLLKKEKEVGEAAPAVSKMSVSGHELAVCVGNCLYVLDVRKNHPSVVQTIEYHGKCAYETELSRCYSAAIGDSVTVWSRKTSKVVERFSGSGVVSLRMHGDWVVKVTWDSVKIFSSRGREKAQLLHKIPSDDFFDAGECRIVGDRLVAIVEGSPLEHRFSWSTWRQATP